LALILRAVAAVEDPLQAWEAAEAACRTCCQVVVGVEEAAACHTCCQEVVGVEEAVVYQVLHAHEAEAGAGVGVGVGESA